MKESALKDECHIMPRLKHITANLIVGVDMIMSRYKVFPTSCLCKDAEEVEHNDWIAWPDHPKRTKAKGRG